MRDRITGSLRFSKLFFRKYPKWVITYGVLFDMMEVNRSLVGWVISTSFEIVSRKAILSELLKRHVKRKWVSSSISPLLQKIHVLSSIAGLGLLYRSVSILSECELILNLAIVVLSVLHLTSSRYVSNL